MSRYKFHLKHKASGSRVKIVFHAANDTAAWAHLDELGLGNITTDVEFVSLTIKAI